MGYAEDREAQRMARRESGRCEDCGSDQNVQYREDPYASEINDDHTQHFICDVCYALSCDEI